MALIDTLLAADRRLDHLHALREDLAIRREAAETRYLRAVSGEIDDPDGAIEDAAGTLCDDLSDEIAGLSAEIDGLHDRAARAAERSWATV
jgi:hypothetical protein